MGCDLGVHISFLSPQGVTQSPPPPAPISAGRAVGLLKELPAERLVSHVRVS